MYRGLFDRHRRFGRHDIGSSVDRSSAGRVGGSGSGAR